MFKFWKILLMFVIFCFWCFDFFKFLVLVPQRTRCVLSVVRWCPSPLARNCETRATLSWKRRRTKRTYSVQRRRDCQKCTFCSMPKASRKTPGPVGVSGPRGILCSPRGRSRSLGLRARSKERRVKRSHCKWRGKDSRREESESGHDRLAAGSCAPSGSAVKLSARRDFGN